MLGVSPLRNVIRPDHIFLCFHYFCIETPSMEWYNGINPHEKGGKDSCAVTAGFSRFVRC